MSRRTVSVCIGSIISIVLGLAIGVTTTSAALEAGPASIFGTTVPTVLSDDDTARVELGVQFTSGIAGQITGIRFFKGPGNTGTHTGTLWSGSRRIATATFTNETASNWQQLNFAKPVTITAGRTYTASYLAPAGRYAADNKYLFPKSSGNLTAIRGVYKYGGGYPRSVYQTSNYWVDVLFIATTPAGTTTPTTSGSATTSASTTTTTPTTTASTTTTTPTTKPVTTSPTATTTTNSTVSSTTAPPPANTWPGNTNTGVPIGVALAAYTGPMTITSPTTIDAKTISGTLIVKAPLTITRSKLFGNIDGDYGSLVTVSDSEIDGGSTSAPAVGYSNVSMKRVNVHGSRVSVLCGNNCDIQDSWLHAQYMAPGSDWHVNGYVSNGGRNVLVKHNTIACDVQDNNNGGGCTGPAASFGDFEPLLNITYESNLFVASPGGYCLAAGYNPSKPYGANPTNIRVTGNVFQRGPNRKCASYGPVTSFLAAYGNLWSGNTWDDGETVPAA